MVTESEFGAGEYNEATTARCPPCLLVLDDRESALALSEAMDSQLSVVVGDLEEVPDWLADRITCGVVVEVSSVSSCGLALVRLAADAGHVTVAVCPERSFEIAIAAHRAGAAEIVATAASPDALLCAVRRAHLHRARQLRIPSGAVPGLSHRESEVARLLARSLRPKEIAQRLYISPATVRNHIGRIYTKLDVHNAVELVRRVLAGGMMPHLLRPRPRPDDDVRDW